MAALFLVALCVSDGMARDSGLEKGAPFAAPAALAVATPFATNSLIIPMDTTFQDSGMLRAYGLVHKLLLNGITVHWVIAGGKAVDGVDMTLNVKDIATNTNINAAQYRGGPFVVAAADRTAALAIMAAWNLTAPVVTVHSANANFTADVARSLSAAPRIAVFADGNEIIAFGNLNAAGIPDSTGQAWPAVADVTRVYSGFPDVLNTSEIRGINNGGPADGALIRADGTPAFCQLISMHYEVTPDDELVAEVRAWLNLGPAAHLYAQCFSISQFENSASGRFLTTAGLIDDGSTLGSTIHNIVPDDPLAQYHNGFDGDSGSVDSIGLASGSVLRTNVRMLINRSGTTSTRMLLLSGSLDGNLNLGRITYLAGHDYSTALPVTANVQTNGVRVFLNSLFEPLCVSSAGQPAPSFSNAAPTLTNASTITYTLNYANAGPGLADNLSITDVIPVNSAFVSATAGGTFSSATRTITWSSLGNLKANTSGSVSFTVSVAADGTYTNLATLQYFSALTRRTLGSNTTSTVRDATAPDTTLLTGPTGTVASTSATFTFSSPDPTATFSCALDGAPFAPCTSGIAFASLADGGHSFAVRARDPAGNVDATPATRTWTVNTTAPCTLDIDDDGSVLAATDGLLILRRMMSLSGEALRAGAFNPAGHRLAPVDMAALIDTMIATKTLDLDGNGSVDALTDGLLLMRALTGLGGTAVTNGALGPGTLSRPDWPAIRQYLVTTCGLSNLAP